LSTKDGRGEYHSAYVNSGRNIWLCRRARFRTVDDEDLNTALRARERWGDPMAMAGKKKDPNAVERPKYRGPPPPPNRFNIPPGYRWDGVDRSNGFEAKLITRSTSKAAQELEAYLWSVQDM